MVMLWSYYLLTLVVDSQSASDKKCIWVSDINKNLFIVHCFGNYINLFI